VAKQSTFFGLDYRNFSFYKSQNFLTNSLILNKIVKQAEINSNDIVLEIGAGLGNLTTKIAQKAKKVIAVEIDKRIFPILKENLKEYKNVVPILGDIRKIDLSELGLKDKKYKIVANPPYNIVNYLLRKFLSTYPRPELIVFLIQKEVAYKILGKGKKSKIFYAVHFYAQPKLICLVKRENFLPKPKVDSAVIKIVLKKGKTKKNLEKNFFTLLRAGFSSPRKYLLNNLANNFEKQKVLEAFQSLGIKTNSRASDLPLAKWIALAKDKNLFKK